MSFGSESSEQTPAMALRPFQLDEFTDNIHSSNSPDHLPDVELDLRVELASTQMDVNQVMRLRRGSVVPLDKAVAEPVDLYANEQLVARGEVLVLNDTFCIRITELVGDSTQIAG